SALAATGRSDHYDMLPWLDIKLDFLEQWLATFIREIHLFHLNVSAKRGSAYCPRQIPHIRHAFQQVDNPFAGSGGFGQTTRVLGKVLHRAVGGLEISQEDQESPRSDLGRLSQNESGAIPKHESC